MSSLALQLNLSNINSTQQQQQQQTTRTASNNNNNNIINSSTSNNNNNNNNLANNNTNNNTQNNNNISTITKTLNSNSYSISNPNLNPFYSNSFNYLNNSSNNVLFNNISTISNSNSVANSNTNSNHNITSTPTNTNTNTNNNNSKMQAQNLIYNFKTNHFTNDNNIMETSSNTASSLAFINRIKTLESKKKKNTPLTTQTTLPHSTTITYSNQNTSRTNNTANTLVNSANNNNSNTNSFNFNSNHQTSPHNSNTNIYRSSSTTQQPHTQNHFNHQKFNFTTDFIDSSYLNFQPTQQQNLNISLSPTLERKSGKQQQQQIQRNSASFNKSSQEELAKFRLGKISESKQQQAQPQQSQQQQSQTDNPNAYHDKVSDQKFFNRNYKIKSQGTAATTTTNTTTTSDTNSINNEMTTSYNARYLNDTPSTNLETFQNGIGGNTTRNNSSNHNNTSSEMNRNSLYNSNQPSLNVTTYQQNTALQSNSVNLNRLKLLKKRNALKKTLSNAANLQSSSPTSKSHQNFEYQLHSSSKEDFKSQTSINNLTNRALSMHLSRNSLNNIENSNLGSNHQIAYHKSNETIDELTLSELRQRDTKSSLNRVRSTPHIMTPHNSAAISNHAVNGRTKSENELANLADNFKLKAKLEFDSSQEKLTPANLSSMNKTLAANTNYLNRVKTVAATSQLIPNRTTTTTLTNNRPVSRLDNLNSSFKAKNFNSNNNTTNNNNNNNINVNTLKTTLMISNSKETTNNNSHNSSNLNDSNSNYTVTKLRNDHHHGNDDFRILYPGAYNVEIIKPSTQQVFDMNLGMDAFEPSPYNIMSDPVISEQFRKLYEEDEYFQQVHRKCCEWLNKYVFPEMEAAKK